MVTTFGGAAMLQGRHPRDVTLSASITVKEVRIRRELAGDVAAIRVVNDGAFGRAEEAMLVDDLRQEGAVLGSFVADHDGHVIGHILFSRILIETSADSTPSVALAPRGVLPMYQREALGANLCRSDWNGCGRGVSGRCVCSALRSSIRASASRRNAPAG